MTDRGGGAGWSVSDLAAGRALFLLGMVLGVLVLVAARPLLVLAASATAAVGGLALLTRARRPL